MDSIATCYPGYPCQPGLVTPIWLALIKTITTILFVRTDTNQPGRMLPETEPMSPDTSDQPRVLLLNGRWEKPNSTFLFNARIAIGQGGGAAGAILWMGQGHERAIRGLEQVSGSIAGHHVELTGIQAGPGLVCDCYRITLNTGDTAGRFTGASRAFGDWTGRMSGDYLFENAKK